MRKLSSVINAFDNSSTFLSDDMHFSKLETKFLLRVPYKSSDVNPIYLNGVAVRFSVNFNISS